MWWVERNKEEDASHAQGTALTSLRCALSIETKKGGEASRIHAFLNTNRESRDLATINKAIRYVIVIYSFSFTY